MNNTGAAPLEDDSIMARYYRCPLATRAVCTLSFWVWLCSVLLFEGLPFWLEACPRDILFLQFWRLVTAPLVSRSIIGVLIGCFVFGQIGAAFERKFGTIGFTYMFFLFNLIANSMFVVVVLFLAPLFPKGGLLSPMNCASGTWVFVLGLLVVQTQRSDQPYLSFWGLCNIPTKLYPWFLLFLFALLGGSVLDNLCGVLVGYLFHFGKLNRFIPAESRFVGWDTSPYLSWIHGAPGHITWTGSLLTASLDDGSSGLGNWGSSQSGQSQSRTGNIMSGGVINRGAAQQSQQQPASSSGFSAFQGSGQSLGSTPAATQGSSASWGSMFGGSSSDGQPTSSTGRPLGRLLEQMGGGDSRGTYAQIPVDNPDPATQGCGSSGPKDPEPNEDDIQQLMDMGFPREKAVSTLRSNSNDLDKALGALLSE